MKTYDLIFSERIRHRLSRHIIFWLIFLIYFYYVNLIPSRPEDLLNPKTYFAAFELMIYFPVSVISVYVALYFLLPRYILTEKYLQLFFIAICLTVVYFLIAILITMLLAKLTTNIPYQKLPISFKWFQPVRYGIGLPLTSSVITVIIKLFKTWQLEQKENELLQRQKIETEMKLLKAQFQPHFLYDSLQHIYFLIRKQSLESPATLLKLSDLLSYILYESEKNKVPVEKELEIVKTYLGLKKTFYPETLTIQLNQKIESENLYVAPLLLVSIVENCFAKFMSTKYQQLSLNLNIKTTNKELYFQIECKSNFKNESIVNENYAWLKSLKRVEMLYAGKHSVDVFTENDTTYLLLIIELAEMSPGIKKENEELILQ